MRRWLFRFLILGAVVGLAAAVVAPAAAWWQQRTAPKYLTALVSRGRVETVVNSTGTIKPVLSVSVGAFTSGPIKEVYVDFNSVVKKGDLLAVIDPRLAKATVDHDAAALDAQKADLARVEALVQQAKNNEERARQLVAINKDYLAATDMDTFVFTRLQDEAQYRLGKASIAQAEATLANSQANLGYTEIRSPVDGVVINREVDPGQTVASSFQTPELFVIAPEMDKHMYVYASVDEADIGLIRAAQSQGRVVKFTVDAYPGDLFEGRVHQIRKNSTTTQNVVTYPVVIEAPNPDLKLLPGMTANLSFQIDDERRRLARHRGGAAVRAAARVGPPGRQALRRGSAGRCRRGRDEPFGRRKGRRGQESPTSRRLGPGRAVAAGRPPHARPDRKPVRRSRGRRPQGRPGGRHGDREPVRAEVIPWTSSTCC